MGGEREGRKERGREGGKEKERHYRTKPAN